MSFVGLVSDSTACLHPSIIARHGIRIVPLYIKMGERTLRDGIDITPDEFYEQLPQCTPLPTTSQPSVGDFVAVYQALRDQGASSIVSVHLSAGISGTINSANLAAQQIDGFPIRVIDTQCAAAAHMLAVEAGVNALAQGADLEGVVAAIERAVNTLHIVFTVDTLEYLYKGGRIGGAAALLGSLLQFKPLLTFKDGKIDALERVRKSSRAMARLAEVMAGWTNGEPQRAVVMQAACMDRAEALAAMLPEYLNVVETQIVPLTPVIGAHVGNGTLGLCCCPVTVCGLPEYDTGLSQVAATG